MRLEYGYISFTCPLARDITWRWDSSGAGSHYFQLVYGTDLCSQNRRLLSSLGNNDPAARTLPAPFPFNLVVTEEVKDLKISAHVSVRRE